MEAALEKSPLETERTGLFGLIWRFKGTLLLAIAVAGLASAVLPTLKGPRVAFVTAAKRSLVQRVVATGRVEPPARVNIGALVSGVALQVGPEEGEHVQAGTLLVELDAAEARAAVDQAQAGVGAAQARLVQLRGTGALVASEGLRQAEITLQNAESNLLRIEGMFKASAVTQRELDDARKQAELAKSQRESARLQAASSSSAGADTMLAQANLAQAQAVLAQAKARLSQMKIVAPAPGIVLTRAVEPGDIVTPGKALFLIARDGRTRLVAQPDEKSLAYLREGQAAQASVDAFPLRAFAATVSRIAPSVDPSRGTIEIHLDVPAPPPFLRADMTVSVDVEVGRAEGALVLPADVVQEPASAKPWVWVIAGEEAKLEKRPLRLGLKGEGFVQVEDGLAEGERVLAPDGKLFKAGQTVRPTPRPAAGT
ncbi:MAG TPA: efflux RND transporter periplasmic adaptor subunit [Myxococcales bacterium]|jgi:HlyD family secretion protein